MSAGEEIDKSPTERATHLRLKAAQVRSLAAGVWQVEVRLHLEDYAHELEAQARTAESSTGHLKRS
jgi:hypothetical protein